MAYKLTTAKSADLDRLVELYKLSYPLLKLSDTERHEKFTQNPRCDLEDVYVARDGKEIVGSFIAYQFIQYQENVEVPVMGLARVMVAPEHRRKGVGGFMMQKALEIFEEEDVPAAILYPFEHRFFRSLGWGYAGELRHYSITTSQLYEYLDVLNEKELSVKILPLSDLPVLMNYYNAQARHYNGTLQREEPYWKTELVAPPRQVVLAYCNGEVTGYLIYSILESQPHNDYAQLMVVHEWMATTIDGRDTLLSFLARQTEQIERIELTMASDDPLHLWIDDPRDAGRAMISSLYTKTATMALGWMYRLVNLKSAFECGRRFNGVSGELTVDMEDDVLGNRRLTVNFSGRNAVTDESNNKSKRSVRGEVDALSQMFCGYTSARVAFEEDLLDFEGNDTVDFCQQAFWLPQPRCFDLF